MISRVVVCAGAALLASTGAVANQIDIESGQTNVALDFETLAAVGLVLESVSADVIVPGDIPDSVAFPINARDAAAPALPTTFSYDAADFLGSFSGTIEHTGLVNFEGGITVGDFTIAFDASRVDTNTGASGFFVASTAGLAAPLFDVKVDFSNTSATAGGALIAGDLLVSPELAGVLGDAGLTGADVGDALVDGDVGCTGADVNDDTVFDIRDIRAYIRQFVSRSPAADFDGNGRINGDDFREFFRIWVACRYGY